MVFVFKISDSDLFLNMYIKIEFIITNMFAKVLKACSTKPSYGIDSRTQRDNFEKN